jgi:hypothetical protein
VDIYICGSVFARAGARDVAYKLQKLGMSGDIGYYEDKNLQNKIEIVIYPQFN